MMKEAECTLGTEKVKARCWLPAQAGLRSLDSLFISPFPQWFALRMHRFGGGSRGALQGEGWGRAGLVGCLLLTWDTPGWLWGDRRGWQGGKAGTVNAACYLPRWWAASLPTGEEMEPRISLLGPILPCPEQAAPRPGTAARHPGAAALPEATAAL